MNFYKKIGKRLFDIFFSIIFIILSLPLMLLITFIISLKSKGGIIFRQIRVGRNNKSFTMYKFRTMVEGAEKLKSIYLHLNQADFPLFKISDDPRFTNIGKFLSNTNLDELPQLFNVLKGNMSIVGPRPALPEEVATYKDWQKKRLDIKPGITSLWHVSPGYNPFGKFDDWVKNDIEYINNTSLLLDLKIIYKTILKLKRIASIFLYLSSDTTT